MAESASAARSRIVVVAALTILALLMKSTMYYEFGVSDNFIRNATRICS